MDLGSILGGFWMDLGALGSPNGHEKRYISRKFMSFPKDPSREALGRVLGGFGEVWGRFWDGLEGSCDVFLIDFKVLGGF